MATPDSTPAPAPLQAGLINDPEFLKSLLQILLQQHLDIEMIEHLQASWHERTPKRKGYRNGYRPRSLKTRVGTLELLVPVDRDGTFRTELFEKYQRNEKALVLSLMEMYVQGVSTRKVAAITEKLCGTSFSKSTVSNYCRELDEHLSAWRERPLDGEYPYLVVDAHYQYVRDGGRVVSQGVLIVKGIRADGHREVLAVKMADTESEATYSELFRSLKERGLRGVRLVTSDAHRGLKAAIARFFQGASWQHCQVHYSRNLQDRVARARRKDVASDLRGIFSAPTIEWAIQAARDVADSWRATHRALAEQLEESIEECLVCFSFPPQHRLRVRSTNGLERLHEEIKRRTRVVRIFPNPESCLRLVSALCVETSEEWLSGKRYLEMSWLLEPQEWEVGLVES